ncbi:signal transduction histidine kinase [Nocardioides aromaticivorans]|uniref:histidine kinase n=1 Tax=Nocardioides aromaticivorans TaxID=200618 RepID=A0A7Y9ZGZ8_9ACTN|nr:HAMP domain-containing sensor histidine kinase [Nocardioides aromaticivorans]NYI44675.1 signal transduction histidine kinase [Nocardioides aromaticivorans]
MRERLVIAFVGLTLAVIGLYGVPRAYFLADLVRDQERATLDGTSTALAGLVEERRDAGGEVDAALLEHGLAGADRVEYRPADGAEVAVGDSVDGEGGIIVTKPLPDGGSLRLSVSGETISSSVRDAITPLVLLGLVLAVGSAVLGFAIARRMSRPFQELAGLSRELGRGHFDLDVPSYAVPEAEEIGASLRGAAAQLDDLVRREREFAANASHQLRTPVTALRLGLEDLTLWPETAPEVREELERGIAELDRLNAAVDELLDLARGRRIDAHEVIDLVALATAGVERWERRLASTGRTITFQQEGRRSRTRVPRGPVEQVLDVLLDNARKHGAGTIGVEVRDAGTHLELVVGDEGTRALGTDVFHRGVSTGSAGSEGIGLAVASELADVCGGHLSIDTASATTRFVLWLPPRDRVTAPAGPASG